MRTWSCRRCFDTGIVSEYLMNSISNSFTVSGLYKGRDFSLNYCDCSAGLVRGKDKND